MADVDAQLAKARDALAKAQDAKEALRYERALDHLKSADAHTDKADRAANELRGKKRRVAERKVKAQRERNAFLAVQLASAATADGPPDITETSVVKTIELTLDLVDDILFGGAPGSLFGPGSIINWTGLLNQLPQPR